MDISCVIQWRGKQNMEFVLLFEVFPLLLKRKLNIKIYVGIIHFNLTRTFYSHLPFINLPY